MQQRRFFFTSARLPIATAVLAIAIFIADTITKLEIAVAVLYVLVVLLARRFCRPSGVVLVAAGCVGLTIVSYSLTVASSPLLEGIVNTLISIGAIALITPLVLKDQSRELALREARDHLQVEVEKRTQQALLLDETHDAIFLRNLDGLILYWNRGAQELYGWSAEEAAGKNVRELLKTVFPLPLEEIEALVLRTGRWEGELVHTTRDGTQVTVASRWSLQRDTTGTPIAILHTNTDITERKRAEGELFEMQEQFRVLAESSPTAIYHFLEGRYLYVNPAFARMFGYTAEEVMDRCGPFDLIYPDDRPMVAENMRRRVEGEIDGLRYEFRGLRKDGTAFPVEVHGRRIERGGKIALLGTLVDNTERKRAEEELRASEMRYRTLVDHAADAILLRGGDGKLIDVNQHACDILGYTREEMIGMTPRDLVDPNEDPAFFRSVTERLHAGETFAFESGFRRKDGTVFPIEVRVRPFSQGGQRFFLAIARDITERKQAEQERERLRGLEAELAHINRVNVIGEMTASIAHEINQPLSGVVSNGSACLGWLAGDSPNLEEAREAALRIVRDGKRAGEVIARIRSLATRAAIPREQLDLNETIHDVLSLVVNETKKNGIAIRTQLADELSPVVGDRIQLQQVLLNLVMNAIEATRDVDGRTRELVIRTSNTDADQVQVAVQDSGIGLEPDKIRKIFAPFYTTKRGGMGMGLSISRSIIRSHGGQLSATPNQGPGTTFYFTLPKYPPEGSTVETAAG